jgi:UPF0042 nucleotide-binding protein
VADSALKNRRLIIVSGLSGAGKSHVLNTLEDQGYYCIDNLPISLFNQMAKLLIDPVSDFPFKVGVGIDARSPATELLSLPEFISRLRDNGVAIEIVFMEANKEVLTMRFSETRRKHPLSSDEISLTDAIDKEKEILSALSDIADLKIDTSYTTVHGLRELICERMVDRPEHTMSMQFISFGYKHGAPHDADFLFDVRCLPNPHWEKHLRPYSGRDRQVIDYLRQHEVVSVMIDNIRTFLEAWIPHFERENRSYLCIGIGCTGGHHRSVYLVEQLSCYFKDTGKHVVVRHRDL